jgi:glucose/arabinose dehydrogenase
MCKHPGTTSARAALLAAFFTALAACGGGGDRDVTVEPPPPPPPPPAVTLNVQRVFSSLANFSSPVAMLQAPSADTYWYVVEQGGRILIFENLSSVTTRDTFADLTDRVDSGGEMGLLGMAFHPSYPTNPRVYVFYTNADAGRVSRVSAFTVDLAGADGPRLNPASEQILLTVNQPESNHNGGHLVFGPDGFLYIGMGDGGGSYDQHGAIGNAQTLTNLLGKILRIDVDGASGAFAYRVPGDNPHALNPFCGANGTGAQNCPEIYAYGLRNPWRWSFDRQGSQLWVADVGQSTREEVNRVTLGGNYGWRCREGTSDTGRACGALPDPVAPVAEYGRSLGSSITGGFVYRGSAIPGLAGRYVFGDFGSGRIWHIAGDTAATLTVTGGFESDLSISSFGQGSDGELYVVDYGGQLYRITGA